MKPLMGSLALVVALLVGGCSAGGSSADGAVSEGVEQAASDQSAPQAEPLEEAAGGGAAGGTDTAVEDGVTAADDRQFVTEGSVSLKVDDPSDASQEAARLVESVDGFVQERVEQVGADGEPATAYLVVRIPSAQVTPTIAALKELGEIESSTLVSTEVTAQARDLDARIRALQLSIARLEELLAGATSIPDIVESEQILLERQSELEVLQSQAKALSAQVAMATFRIDLWSEGGSPPVEPEEPPTGFFAGLVSGWNALMATLTGVLQVIGALLPWLAFAGLVAIAVVALRRWLKQRWPAKAPAAAPLPPATAYAVDPRSQQGPPPPWPNAQTGTGQQHPQHQTQPAGHQGSQAQQAAPVAAPADPFTDRSRSTEPLPTSGAAAAPKGRPRRPRDGGPTPPA